MTDPLEASDGELRRVIMDIVDVEGPVVAGRVFGLVVEAAGRRPLSRGRKKALNQAVAQLVREKHLTVVDRFSRAPMLTATLTTPRSDPLAIRERGPRLVEHIPPAEIQQLASVLRSHNASLIGRPLVSAVLASYGGRSPTGPARRYVAECLEGEASAS